MKSSKRYLVAVGLLCVLAGRLAAVEPAQPFPQKHVVAKVPVSAEWIAEEGVRFGKSPTVNADDIKLSAKGKLMTSGAKPTQGDIDVLAYKIMVQASAQSKADLKASMAAMKKTTEEKKAQREAADKSLQPHKPASQVVGQVRDPDEILLQQAKERQVRLDKMIAEAKK